MTQPPSFISKAKVLATDIGERAFWAFVWAFSGFVVSAYTLGELTDLADVNALKKVGGAALAAGVAAAFSAVKGYLASLKTGTASASKTVAISAVVPAGTAANVIEQSDPHEPEHEAPPAN